MSYDGEASSGEEIRKRFEFAVQQCEAHNREFWTILYQYYFDGANDSAQVRKSKEEFRDKAEDQDICKLLRLNIEQSSLLFSSNGHKIRYLGNDEGARIYIDEAHSPQVGVADGKIIVTDFINYGDVNGIDWSKKGPESVKLVETLSRAIAEVAAKLKSLISGRQQHPYR